MEENEEYRDWFLTVNKRFGADVLLDNSIFELGESFDPEKYAYWLRKINPNYYIVPDVLEDAAGTMHQWRDWSLNHKPAENKSLKIGVVQGKTWQELVDCYRFMAEEADYIAISFDYSYYKYTGTGRDKLELWCSGRQRFIQDLIDKGYWEWSKPHHLLGCSLAKEFGYYVDKGVTNIRSCDTSNPIVAALKGLRYNGNLGLQQKPSTMLCDLITANVDEDTLDDVVYNTKMFKHIVGRYDDQKELSLV
tara:strand:- start:5404 stop:6150 length:747 start_codon:yes stop_codon:yes gene_type:complete